MSGEALHDLVAAIIAGLRELDAVCHRPHGNLKAENVLLDGKGLAGATVALTDPASAAVGKTDGQAADLHALGDLIHQLVLRRPFAGDAAWPIPDGPEWGRLGAGGRQWQKLCSDLLAPQARAKPAGLDAVAATLGAIQRVSRRRLRVRVPRSVKLAAAVALVLALAGAGAVAALDYSARRELVPGEDAVAGGVRVGRRGPGPRTVVRVRRRPPGGRRGRAARRRPAIDCDVRLARLRPWQYPADRSRLASVRRAEAGLTPARWQRLATDAALAQKFRERGWTQPAQYLGDLVDGVRPAAGAALCDAIDRLLSTDEQLRHDLPAVESDWDELARRRGSSTPPTTRS